MIMRAHTKGPRVRHDGVKDVKIMLLEASLPPFIERAC